MCDYRFGFESIKYPEFATISITFGFNCTEQTIFGWYEASIFVWFSGNPYIRYIRACWKFETHICNNSKLWYSWEWWECHQFCRDLFRIKCNGYGCQFTVFYAPKYCDKQTNRNVGLWQISPDAGWKVKGQNHKEIVLWGSGWSHQILQHSIA